MDERQLQKRLKTNQNTGVGGNKSLVRALAVQSLGPESDPQDLRKTPGAVMPVCHLSSGEAETGSWSGRLPYSVNPCLKEGG